MPDNDRDRLKVVAHLVDGSLVKGFLEGADSAFDPLAAGAVGLSLPPDIQLQLSTGDKRRVDLRSAKAVFFVKTFDGRDDYTELKFFERNPQIEGLWVKIKFQDNETTEGIVHNSIPFVRDPGFFLRPPDPHSNNRVVYVMKNYLSDFRVLGIRTEY